MDIECCLYCSKPLPKSSKMRMHLKCSKEILKSGIRIGEDTIAVKNINKV